jgi:osmotically-inducible protein OsmY
LNKQSSIAEGYCGQFAKEKVGMKTDIQLQRDVLNELQWEPSVNAAEIGVSVKEGVVTLTGFVDSFAEKMTAERAAKRVYGVKALANEIEVRLPGSSERTDVDMARAALSAIEWDISVPHEQIKVTVRDGWVTLEGYVDWEYQKEATERALRNLTGIRGIINLISVKPAVTAEDIKAKIDEAFKRSAEFEARRISVETQGSKVILSGYVRSWAERNEAEHSAWSAPGVTDVENRIMVMV